MIRVIRLSSLLFIICLLLTYSLTSAQGVPPSRPAILQNAAGNGNGDEFNADTYSIALVAVYGTASGANGTVTFQGYQDSNKKWSSTATDNNIICTNVKDNTQSATATVSGTTLLQYRCPISGMIRFRAVISSNTTSTVNVSVTALQNVSYVVPGGGSSVSSSTGTTLTGVLYGDGATINTVGSVSGTTVTLPTLNLTTMLLGNAIPVNSDNVVLNLTDTKTITDNNFYEGLSIVNSVAKTTTTFTGSHLAAVFEPRIGATNTQNWTDANQFGQVAAYVTNNIQVGATGTLSHATGLFVNADIGGMTVTTRRGIWIENPYTHGGAISTLYGLYITGQTVGSTNYNIYSAGTALNYFGGDVRMDSNVGIGRVPSILGNANYKYLTLANASAIGGAIIEGQLGTASATQDINLLNIDGYNGSTRVGEWSFSGDGSTTSGNFILYLKTTAGSLAQVLKISSSGFISFQGQTTSFPALKRNGAILEAWLADGSTYTTFKANTMRTPCFAVASLPTGVVGDRACINDQLTTCPVLSGTFTGGGAVVCSAFYNGTDWVHE